MSEPRKVKPLAMMEAKARQLMLMVGFGFVAFTGGTFLTLQVMNRITHKLVAADSYLLSLVARFFVGNLWILLVLPGMIHLASRFLDLPIWRTAVIGAMTGMLFNLSIRFVSSGIDQTFGDPVQNVFWVGSLISGVLFSVWAGKQGRAWAERRQKVADEAAAARKGQYDQFLAESTALADRRDAARAAPVEGRPVDAAAPPTAAVPPAPSTDAQDSVQPERRPQAAVEGRPVDAAVPPAAAVPPTPSTDAQDPVQPERRPQAVVEGRPVDAPKPPEST